MRPLLALVATLLFLACAAPSTSTNVVEEEAAADASIVQWDKSTPFGSDLVFLRKHDPNLIVLSKNDNYLLTSAKYQGKVFTTTNRKATRPSFGYINRNAFGLETPAEHINGYGSENRLWIGPEAGPHAVFFKKGVAFTSENWYTPAAVDFEEWDLIRVEPSQVSYEKEATFKGRQGVSFKAKINRDVALLGQDEIEALYQYDTAAVGNLEVVGYTTRNALTNTGTEAWTRESGTICLWLLDMLPAGDEVTIVLPFESPQVQPLLQVKQYFGDIPSDRLKATSRAVHMRGDGKFTSKVGLPPTVANNRVGSIDLKNEVLTIVYADVESNATYLSMEWKEGVDPYAGDAMTSYNDRGEQDGSIGTFYEIESIAPASFLKPGEKSVHIHNVYHFTGEREDLIAAARELLGYDPDLLD